MDFRVLRRFFAFDNLEGLFIRTTVSNTSSQEEADLFFQELLVSGQDKATPLSSLRLQGGWEGPNLSLRALEHGTPVLLAGSN